MNYKLIVLVCVIILMLLINRQINRVIIPKVIHKIYIQHDNQFGKIPDEILDAHQSWRDMNPGYEIKFYNGDDCEQYLLKYYDKIHYDTYKNINAYSGKCDFMRACIVYNEGGWYTDWKTVCLKPLEDFDLSYIHWVSSFDIQSLMDEHHQTYMMTNFFGAPRHHLLLKTYINNIIKNTKNRYYGNNPLDPTACGCFGKSYDEIKHKLDHKHMILGIYDDIHKGCHTFFEKEKWVQSKCDLCTKDQNWENGNNYNVLWGNRTYFK